MDGFRKAHWGEMRKGVLEGTSDPGFLALVMAADDEVEGSALDKDGEGDGNVGGAKDPSACKRDGNGEGESDGEASAEAAPGHGKDGAAAVLLAEAEDSGGGSYDGEADGVHGEDCGGSGAHGEGVE